MSSSGSHSLKFKLQWRWHHISSSSWEVRSLTYPWSLVPSIKTTQYRKTEKIQCMSLPISSFKRLKCVCLWIFKHNEMQNPTQLEIHLSCSPWGGVEPDWIQPFLACHNGLCRVLLAWESLPSTIFGLTSGWIRVRLFGIRSLPVSHLVCDLKWVRTLRFSFFRYKWSRKQQ